MNAEFINQIKKAAGAYAYVKTKNKEIIKAEQSLREYKRHRSSENQKIPELEEKINRTRTEIILGHIGIMLVCIILAGIIVGSWFLAAEAVYMTPSPWWGYIVALIALLGTIPSIIADIAFLIWPFKCISELKNYNKEKSKAQKELARILGDRDMEDEKIAEFEKNIEEARYVAQETEKLMTPLIEYFPQKYRNDHAIVFLLEYAENGRADSLKEALNLYEQHLYMKRQEQMIENAIDTARENSAALEAAMRDVEKAQRDVEFEIKRIYYEKKLYKY